MSGALLSVRVKLDLRTFSLSTSLQRETMKFNYITAKWHVLYQNFVMQTFSAITALFSVRAPTLYLCFICIHLRYPRSACTHPFQCCNSKPHTITPWHNSIYKEFWLHNRSFDANSLFTPRVKRSVHAANWVSDNYPVFTLHRILLFL